MKRRIAVATVLALIGAGAAALPRRAPSSKPEAPLQLRARFVGTPQAGSTCGVTVGVTALTDGDVTVDSSLPNGVTFVRGTRSLARSLRKGDTREMTFDIHVPDAQKREILFTATLRKDGTVLTCVCPLVLNDDGVSPAPTGTYKTDARGRAILEYKAE